MGTMEDFLKREKSFQVSAEGRPEGFLEVNSTGKG